MGVRTEDVSVTTVDQGRPQRVRKETYTTAALPFPSSHITHYLDRWRKDFRSTLLDWAGTGENPYGTNTIMRQAVKQTWYVLRLTVRSNVKPKCGNNSSESLHVFLLFRVSA